MEDNYEPESSWVDDYTDIERRLTKRIEELEKKLSFAMQHISVAFEKDGACGVGNAEECYEYLKK